MNTSTPRLYRAVNIAAAVFAVIAAAFTLTDTLTTIAVPTWALVTAAWTVLVAHLIRWGMEDLAAIEVEPRRAATGIQVAAAKNARRSDTGLRGTTMDKYRREFVAKTGGRYHGRRSA